MRGMATGDVFLFESRAIKPLLTHTAAILVTAGLTAGIVTHPAKPVQVQWEVHFSPNGGCTQALVDEINKAQKEILVQAYSFTSKPIADALIAAHARGVVVEIIVDKSQPLAKGEQSQQCFDAGILVWIDKKHAIAHNKVLIFDGAIVATGSFNLTESAELWNAENSIIIHDVVLAKRYVDNWGIHRDHSEAWK